MFLNNLKKQSSTIQGLLEPILIESFQNIINHIENVSNPQNIYNDTESFILKIIKINYFHKLNEINVQTESLNTWIDWKIILSKNKLLDIPEKTIKFIDVSLSYKLLSSDSDKEDYLNSIIIIAEWHIEIKKGLRVDYSQNLDSNEDVQFEINNNKSFYNKNKKLIIPISLLFIFIFIFILSKNLIKPPTLEDNALQMDCGDTNDPIYNFEERRKHIESIKDSIKISNSGLFQRDKEDPNYTSNILKKALENLIAKCKRKQITFEKFPNIKWDKMSITDIENFLLTNTPQLKSEDKTKEDIINGARYHLRVTDEMLKENPYLITFYREEHDKYKAELIELIEDIIYNYYSKEEQNDSRSN